MSQMLKNKVCLITGAARGIGKASAILFAKEGATLLLADLDEAPLNETVLEVKKYTSNVIGLKNNVTKKDDCEHVIKTASEKLGFKSIDVLCNIAGITRDKMIHKMTLEDWNFILEVNLTGTFNMIQAASPYMRESARKEKEENKIITPRSIINISSISGKGNIGQANYASSKAGVEGLTKTVAKEWAAFNIRCNAIAPGYIDTRLTQSRKDNEDFGIPEAQRNMILEMQKNTGLARESGKPEDIANVILFFASSLSEFVTGQVLTVAGGLLGTI